jgi:glycosyltransferase domain-containing protein
MYNLTIIIPTHQRHSYFSRINEYFKNIKAFVIVIDSTEIIYNGKFSENIKYFHEPNKTFSEKILFSLLNSKTNYFALCADDDFVIFDTIYKGVKLLQENKSISTILGKSIAFHENFNGKYYHNNLDSTETLYLAQNSVKLFFNNYTQVLWGLYRREVLEKAFQIVLISNFQNENFIELVLGGICCNTGGIIILNDLLSVRELSAKVHWGDKNKSIVLQYFESPHHNDFKKFKKNVDAITKDGFAKKILLEYINMKKLVFLKFKLKYFIKHILKAIRPVIDDSNTEYSSSYIKYSNLNIYVPNPIEAEKLESVSQILNQFH